MVVAIVGPLCISFNQHMPHVEGIRIHVSHEEGKSQKASVTGLSSLRWQRKARIWTQAFAIEHTLSTEQVVNTDLFSGQIEYT